jgi:quercetin dioxygenase-like cupin family protein
MAGLETHTSCDTDALVLQLEKDVDSFRRGRLCLEDLKRIAAAKICALETSLRAISDFRHACDCARAFTPSGNQRVYSQSISESGHYRMTLLGIHRQSPVPVHDHPGMISLVHLLEGQLHAPQYEITAHGDGNMLVELTSRSSYTLDPGDIAIVMTETGSLHSLRSLVNNAVCLTLQLHIEQGYALRSWYFPRDLHKQGMNPALWYRIRNKEISNVI